MPIEPNYLAPSHETLKTYFEFLVKYTQLNRPLKDVVGHCLSKQYQLSIDKAVLLIYVYTTAPHRSCSVHHVIVNHWYPGLNPSYILKQLCEGGFMTKQSHQEDKRKTVLVLSSRGSSLAQEIQRRMERLLHARPGLIQSLSHCIDSMEQLRMLLP